ncbi:MAG: DUF1573 domain-containing protein [Cytophagaceae bacterium]|nr:DUF1573 domain-containing protein [Cytophagaceae bacterium]
MMIRLIYTLLLTGFFAFTANAQTGTALFKFEKTTHDFGDVPEGNPVTYEFKFTNTGTVPLVIADVKASCGCTTPKWTNEPVAPGKTGKITAQYNTLNRPGSFNKNLTIMANTEPAVTVLYIKGNVLARVRTPEELYPRKVGAVRMFSGDVYLARVTTKEPTVKDVIFYNDGTDTITFSASNLPSHIEVSFHPQKLKPKDKTIMKLTYNAAKKNDLGPVEDIIVITTSEAADNKKELRVVAEIHEYFPPLSPEDAANAPKLSLSKSILDFGNVKAGVASVQEMEITNTGKQDLQLKKVRSGAPYIVIKSEKNTVKPGQTAKVKITYTSPAGRTGVDNQFIWIHSNDPLMPTQSITVKASITQ